jgi:hypothetical protein
MGLKAYGVEFTTIGNLTEDFRAIQVPPKLDDGKVVREGFTYYVAKIAVESYSGDPTYWTLQDWDGTFSGKYFKGDSVVVRGYVEVRSWTDEHYDLNSMGMDKNKELVKKNYNPKGKHPKRNEVVLRVTSMTAPKMEGLYAAATGSVEAPF